MSKHKKQHVIPNCYLKAWCDPRSPAGQTPYIWRIQRDGSDKAKKSPEKSFVASDRYTVKLPNGERNLVIEQTLSGIENDFVRVLTRIRRREKLTAHDRARLCVFAAAMHTRTLAMGDHWKKTHQELHEKVVALEKHHNAEPVTSFETATMVEYAPQLLLATSLDIQPPLLFQMALSIMVSDDELGFITSDMPCVWFNPEAYKLPPFYRSPGLAQREIQVTLPLTPQHLMVISHHHEYPQYVNVKQGAVDEFNRITRFHCDKEFVSWKGETRPYWFDPGKEPDDSWEKSPEGKEALERQKEYERMQLEHEESPAKPDQGPKS